MKITKNDIGNRIDSFIAEKMTNETYECKEIPGKKLLSWNRFDLALKLFYLDHHSKIPELAQQMYKEDIRCQTLGKFVEYGQEENKDSFLAYIASFKKTYEHIRDHGFKAEESLVPLCKEKSIINGAHRVASAIKLNKNICCIETEQPTMIADYSYFLDRGLTTSDCDRAALTYLKYCEENIYMAFLWPSGTKKKKESEKLFSKIVYSKKIILNSNGAFNLLYELYNHMDWVGSYETGFNGIKQKLIECFPSFEPLTIILFESDSLEEVKSIKQKVREIHGIGFSSIHITDTKGEAIKVAKLLFNSNGLHFLNHADPYKYTGFLDELDKFKASLVQKNFDAQDVVIDGSCVLTLYGIRKNRDIDFLYLHDDAFDDENSNLSSHDDELKFHGVSKKFLILDDKYNFQFHGLKFISFHQTYEMKKRRNEDKDRNDLLLMRSKLKGESLAYLFGQILSMYSYYRIKLGDFVWKLFLKTLSMIGIYGIARSFYRALWRKK